MSERKPQRNAPPAGGEQWGLDPRDVQFHARRIGRERTVGPLGKVFRIGAGALVLVGAFFVYWNFDTLSRLRFDFSGLADAIRSERSGPPGVATEPGELRTEVVEGNRVAGVNVPTDAATAPAGAARPADAEPPATDPFHAAANAVVNVGPAERPATAVIEAPAEPAPPPKPVPEAPPGPEEFGFASSSMSVSEADASAAILVLRDGDIRRPSFITWWTTDGTAKAGTDFGRLERRTERFAGNEQNRTLHVPIIGDRNVEGAENFVVHVGVGENATDEVAKIEVVILDDD